MSKGSHPFLRRRAPRVAVLLVACLAALPGTVAGADAAWSVEARLGAPVIAERRVTIAQAGEPDLSFDARFDGQTTRTPYHYDLRLVRRHGGGAWALSFLHSKLLLKDGPPEVTDFQMTHGYNLLTVQRLWRRGLVDLMAGAGVALAHAESTVRGQVFPQDRGLFGWGYHAVAPVATAGIGREVALGRRWSLTGEARLSWSRARVPIAAGQARFSDLEAHFLAGIGIRLGSPATD